VSTRPDPRRACSASCARCCTPLPGCVCAGHRPALRVPGESLVAVPPLPVPEPETVLGAAAAIQCPALALFADRASTLVRQFAITAEDHAPVGVSRACP
jgi:predicted ATPase